MYNNRINISVRKILIIFLLLGNISVCGCSNDETKKFHTTNVVRADMHEHGNYVYCDHSSIYRINTNLNELSYACMDPECKMNCILDGPFAQTDHIENNRLYFHTIDLFNDKVYYAYQDLISGKITIFKILSTMELSSSDRIFISNGYVYYTYRILREGGDVNNEEDYYPYICCQSVDGGEERILVQDDGTLIMVADGKIFTHIDGIIWCYDINSMEKELFWSFKESGYINFATMPSYLNGKIYFLARCGTYEECKYTGKKFNHSKLICIDIYTGEYKQLLETSIITFTLTDNKIYYSPMVLRYMYISPEDSKINEMKVFLADATLYSCNIDGSDVQAIYTNDMVDYIESYTVVDNKLYGWFCNFDKTINNWGKEYFGMIDFATDSITYIGDYNK